MRTTDGDDDSLFDDATLVDGKEARIVKTHLLAEEDETLGHAIEALEIAQCALGDASTEATAAARAKKSAQDALNECVSRVIAAQEREREPRLAL